MKSTPARLAAVLALAAAAFGAQAQTPPAAPGSPAASQHMGMREGHGPMDGARMQEHFQRRMDGLKRILQLTPAQDSAWNAWVAVMKPPANMQRPDREAFAHMSTPQRIDQMRQMRAQRTAEMDKRADATKTFYAQLTPSQQKAFDEVSLKFLSRHHGRHHRGM